jgi:nucleoid DNA-binding protein
MQPSVVFCGKPGMTNRRTITKKELVLRISELSKQKQTVTRDIIQMFIDEVIQELARDNRIELRDFGVFEVKMRNARKARNPKTGHEIRVPEKRVVTIKPGKKMKDEINRHAEARIAAELAAGSAPAAGAVAPAPLPMDNPNQPDKQDPQA